MLHDPTFWVAVAFFIFMGIAVYYKVPGVITAALDKRAAAIATQLEEARSLREEAQALLASYERQTRDAEKEAQDIVDHAKHEAKRQTEEAKIALEAMIERRTRQADDKIARAEAQALKRLQGVSADIAIRAARRLIEDNLDPARTEELANQAIAELDENLH